MTKKRIADLLKEEVEKPVPEAESSTDKPTAKTEAKSSTKAGASKTSASKTAASKASASKTVAAKSSRSKTTAKATATKPTAESTAESTSTDTNTAALNKKIKTLEAALIKAESQISALQDDVNTHQDRIFELKDSLETAENESKNKDADLEKISAQLKEARQTILKISENQNAEKERLAKAEEQTIRETAEREAAEEKAATEAAAEAKKLKAEKQKSSLSYRRPYSSYKSIPEYAIQRGTPASGQNSSMLDDDDIGWVD